MVYKRFKRRRTYIRRKKRVYRKKSSLRVTRRVNVNKDVHFFKRSFFSGTINGSATHNPYLEGLYFTFSQLPNVSEFSSLFDRYMITHAKVYYHLKIDPSAQTASTATFPKMYIVKDYDDSAVPASLNALREHSKCYYKVMTPNRPVVINIKPAILDTLYRSAVSSSYSPKWRQWVDMANTDVPHYGWKIGIDDLTNTNYKVECEVKLWFACKDTR